MKQPYQLEGFHLSGNTAMEKWYTEKQLVDDGSVTATVSSRKLTYSIPSLPDCFYQYALQWYDMVYGSVPTANAFASVYAYCS